MCLVRRRVCPPLLHIETFTHIYWKLAIHNIRATSKLQNYVELRLLQTDGLFVSLLESQLTVNEKYTNRNIKKSRL